MTFGAGGLAIASYGHQLLPFLQAAFGDISDEAGCIVAQLRALEVLWDLNDALTDRLGHSRSVSDQHPSRDVSFGHGAGFDDPNPGLAWKSCEIPGGLSDLLPRRLGFVRNHVGRRQMPRFGTLARAAAEIGDLVDDVAGR